MKRYMISMNCHLGNPTVVLMRLRAFIKVLAALCFVALLGTISFDGDQANAAEPTVAALPAELMTLAQNNPFNSLVGKKRVRRNRERTKPVVQRYVLDGENRAFLFQEVGSRARIQFLCLDEDPRIDCQIDQQGSAVEIHQLLPIRAPRGDVIYKSLQGETVLRIASYGGATVWWPGAKEAEAASRSFSDRRDLMLAPANQPTVWRRARRATALLSAMTATPIEFDTGLEEPLNEIQRPEEDSEAVLTASARLGRSPTTLQAPFSAFAGDNIGTNNNRSPDSLSGLAMVDDGPTDNIHDTVLADLVVMASKGMAAVASDPTGARVLGNRLELVRFVQSQKPSLSLDKKILQIGFNPELGLYGRPSSSEIEQFLEENL